MRSLERSFGLGNATNNGMLTLSGVGTLTGSRTLTLNSDVTYSGNIGQTGGAWSLTKAGAGTLISPVPTLIRVYGHRRWHVKRIKYRKQRREQPSWH